LAYSLDEAPEVAGLGTTTIKEAIRDGDLPVVEIGKRVLVLDEDPRAYLARHRVTRGNRSNGSDEVTHEPEPEVPAPPVRSRGRPAGSGRRRR
jgi:hypothetical protein